MRISSSSQLIEQRLPLFQIGRAKTLGEPTIERGEKVVRFRPPPLFAPQPGETRRRAQFQRLRLLGLGDPDRLPKGGLTLIKLVFGEQYSAGQAVQFRIPQMLAR